MANKKLTVSILAVAPLFGRAEAREEMHVEVVGTGAVVQGWSS
jgi:hypothetical protein